MSGVPHPPLSSDPAMDSVLAHISLKMAQAAALATPPLYLAVCGLRMATGRPSGFSLNRMLRASWMAPVGAAAIGTPLAYQFKLRQETQVAMESRSQRLKLNPGQRETDDFSVIGAVVGALLAPTLFLRRARRIHLILGGASLGMAGGVIAHILRSQQQGQQVKPDLEGMLEDISEAGQTAGDKAKKAVGAKN